MTNQANIASKEPLYIHHVQPYSACIDHMVMSCFDEMNQLNGERSFEVERKRLCIRRSMYESVISINEKYFRHSTSAFGNANILLVRANKAH